MALVMNPAVDAIILAVVTLSALAKVLAPVLRAVVEGIAIVWNAVLTELSKVLDFLAHALPGGMGDAARALQQQVEGMKINTGGFDSAVQQTTNSLNQMSASAKAYSDSAQASFQKWIADSEKARADWAAYQDLLSKGDKGGAAAALASYKQDEKNKTADLLQQQIDEAKSYQAQGHGNDEYIYGGKDTGRTYTQEIEELLKEQAEANAKNTAATQGNTAATNALNHAMTNVPANFKTAQVVNQVLSGQFSGSGGGTRFGGDPTAGRSAPGLRDRINSVLQGGTYNEVVIQGDVHVHADGADIFEAIKRKISEDKRVRTGSSARDLTNRFANLGQG
jgi:cell division septum initiation protein DivIVA